MPRDPRVLRLAERLEGVLRILESLFALTAGAVCRRRRNPPDTSLYDICVKTAHPRVFRFCF
jgi:hypothetical protein